MERRADEGRVDGVRDPGSWTSNLIGRQAYAPVADLAELGLLEGVQPEAGVYVVQPDAYGTTGKVLARADGSDMEELKQALVAGLEAYKPEAKDSTAHVKSGRRKGIRWETDVPVTDPHGRR